MSTDSSRVTPPGLGGGDPLFGNKIAGAVLGSLLLAVGLNIFSEAIYAPRKPSVPGYDLPSPEPEAAAGAGEQQAQAEPLPVLLASADATKGQAAAKKCLACHIFDKGGPNKIGPNLYGVVGRPKGSHEGFAYSAAMKGKGGDWTYEDINQFITNPKAYVPGTIMAFAGVSSPKERADILAFLRTLSDNPVPFPKPEAAAAEAPGVAPATGGAPGGAAAPPGPSQAGQPAAPPIPGNRAQPGPAPVQATPQPADPQVQTTTPNQPQPPATGAAPTGTPPTASGSPTAAPTNAPAAQQPAPPSQTGTDTAGPAHEQ